MSNRSTPNSSSPQPTKHNSDSPVAEQLHGNKDSPAPSQEASPAAEEDDGAGEIKEEAPEKMTLDISNIRRPGEKTYTQRCRLFVGGLTGDISEEEFTNMFTKYGQVNEVFVNRERGFGFVRLVRQTFGLILYCRHIVSNSRVILVLTFCIFYCENDQNINTRS